MLLLLLLLLWWWAYPLRPALPGVLGGACCRCQQQLLQLQLLLPLLLQPLLRLQRHCCGEC